MSATTSQAVIGVLLLIMFIIALALTVQIEQLARAHATPFERLALVGYSIFVTITLGGLATWCLLGAMQ